MKKKIIIAFFVLSFCILFNVNRVSADTPVQGLINQDTIWDKAGSPYVLKGNILVDEGATLTIKEGVNVVFDGADFLQVNGKILAQGNSDNKVVFSYATSTATITAKGIELFSDNNIMDYCEINLGGEEHFEFKIFGSSNEISNCKTTHGVIIKGNSNLIKSCDVESIYVIKKSDSRVMYNSIIDCLINDVIRNGIYDNNGIYLEGADYTTIKNCKIISNGLGYGDYCLADTGIVICNSNNNLVDSCEISGNKMAGVTLAACYNNTITKCEILSNSIGIYIADLYANKPPNYILYNNITDCSSYSISMNRGIGDINISNNYWGTIDKNEIDGKIFDYYDDFGRVKGIYEPYLLKPYRPDLVNSNYQSSTYNVPIQVELSTMGEGYETYYTLDGSDPKVSGILYTQPITLNKTTDLKAVSLKAGVYSEVTTYSYIIYFTSTIQGNITLTSNTNLGGIRVFLVDAYSNVIETTTTTSEGSYIFSNFAPGKYSVKSEKVRFHLTDSIDNITLQTGQVFTADTLELCAGDINDDNRIDIDDLVIMTLRYGAIGR